VQSRLFLPPGSKNHEELFEALHQAPPCKNIDEGMDTVWEGSKKQAIPLILYHRAEGAKIGGMMTQYALGGWLFAPSLSLCWGAAPSLGRKRTASDEYPSGRFLLASRGV
jgi:hypothetical protein